MNETLWGGLTAVAGVIAGGGISLIMEYFRYKWKISERKYLRQKEIIDKRCEQAESYVQMVTADFRNIMRDTEAFLMYEDINEALKREYNRLFWKEHLDTKIFALGPSIRALEDEVLWELWEHMVRIMEKDLYGMYGKAWRYRFEGKAIDKEYLFENLNEIWVKFAQLAGKFYRRLDQIRLKLVETR